MSGSYMSSTQHADRVGLSKNSRVPHVVQFHLRLSLVGELIEPFVFEVAVIPCVARSPMPKPRRRPVRRVRALRQVFRS